MTVQAALKEVLDRFGRTNWKGTVWAKIPLHRNNCLDLLSPETVETLRSLPYAADDTGEIKYNRRQVDEIINLEVWK